MLITVEGGRATRLRGNPAHPVTRGFVCAKVARYLEREYSPERLCYPLKRVGAKGEGRFERIGWDEALDTIARRLEAISSADGPEAILPYSYAGTMGLVQGAGMDRRFFHRLGASRLDRTICSSAGTVALNRVLGFRYGTDPEQFGQARLIIAWGANILGANCHLWPFIVAARNAGARLYTIDPVKNRTGQLADQHFAINPGSDLALALGMIHVTLAEKLHDAAYVEQYTEGADELAALAAAYPPERTAALTGLTVEEIVTLAREYATVKPAVIRLNYGVQRSERGAGAVRAIAMLPALTGQWRHAGGGMLLSTGGAFHLNREGLEMPELQQASPLGRVARLVNMSQLGEALTQLDNPPVKALVVYNSNPAAIAPDQNAVLRGFRREDLFCVVLEQFQTDTADYADIVLPVTTFLEHTDLYYAYGHHYLQMARPVVQPPGEAKPNSEIFRLLAARLGWTEACVQESDEDLIRTALNTAHPFLEGITVESLGAKHFVRLQVAPEGEPFLPFASGGFGTPSGKCDLRPEGLDYEPPVESRHGDSGLSARFPLELITPKADHGLNSTFSYRAEVDEEGSRVSISAADAAARGIRTGDSVRLFNDRGECTLVAEVNDAVPGGVVSARSVRWNKQAADRRNTNVLTSQRLTDAGGGATFYSCLVGVEKCEN